MTGLSGLSAQADLECLLVSRGSPLEGRRAIAPQGQKVLPARIQKEFLRLVPCRRRRDYFREFFTRAWHPALFPGLIDRGQDDLPRQKRSRQPPTRSQRYRTVPSVAPCRCAIAAH